MNVCEECTPSNDPRYQHTCCKCGRLLTERAPVDPTRDPSFEIEFMGDALNVTQRLTGIINNAYPLRVNRRLDVGRERYGDGDYLSKNNLNEVLEETPDLAAYAMLELQRLRRMDDLDRTTFEDIRLDLIAVAAYGAAADWFAQRAAERLAEAT